jgi:hypothetical protein
MKVINVPECVFPAWQRRSVTGMKKRKIWR